VKEQSMTVGSMSVVKMNLHLFLWHLHRSWPN